MSVIAELFVKLGVKGGSEAQKTLGGVKGTLGEISSSGLAAKAAILGAVYGLQRLTSNAGQAGTNLLQFSAASGLSIDALQRYQHQAKLFNVSGEEMESTILNMQKAMQGMSEGHAPEGFARIVGTMGLSNEQIDKMKDNTYYALEVYNEYLRKEKNISFANKSVEGIYSTGMTAAARRGAFTSGALGRAPVLNGQEAKSLDATNVEWKKMTMSFELMISQLTAKHGMGLVKDIGEAAKGVIDLIKALIKLNEVLPVIQLLGQAFKGWGEIFSLIATTIDGMTGGKGGKSDNGILAKAGKMKDAFGDILGDMMWGEPALAGDSVAPKLNPIAKNPNNQSQNVAVTVNNYGVKDANQSNSLTKREIQKATTKFQTTEVK